MHKYALYAEICIRINIPLYANVNMHKICTTYAQICKNMQWPHKHFSYAFICIYSILSYLVTSLGRTSNVTI